MKINIPSSITSEVREGEEIIFVMEVNNIRFVNDGTAITGLSRTSQNTGDGKKSTDVFITWHKNDTYSNIIGTLRNAFANQGELVNRDILQKLCAPFVAECERLSREYEMAR